MVCCFSTIEEKDSLLSKMMRCLSKKLNIVCLLLAQVLKEHMRF